MAKPREALKGTKCGPGSKGPRSSAHSVLTPGLESYFVWTRLTLWVLATSLKRPCALGHMLSNQFSLLDPFLLAVWSTEKQVNPRTPLLPTVVI